MVIDSLFEMYDGLSCTQQIYARTDATNKKPVEIRVRFGRKVPRMQATVEQNRT
jgi:hypothetical protein